LASPSTAASRVALNSILDGVLRSNPAYELVSFDRLSQDQQAILKDLACDPDFYGVLLPRAPGAHGIKSVCHDTARLVRTLADGGRLPCSVEQSLGQRSNQTVAKLVLDGVLEIERDGKFVCGPEAYPVIFASHSDIEPQSVLSRLSQAALQYGQALEIDDASCLSGRLYCYNRIPLTPYWARRLPSENAVFDFLGVSTLNRKGILKNWTLPERRDSSDCWLHWWSRGHPSALPETYRGYKLYVSPQPDALSTAFGAVVEVLDYSAADSFKVGCDPIGILRPDKLVIYFRDFTTLEQTARELSIRLSGCPAQGTPFTAAFADDGLVSWGIDPLPEKAALRWQGPESWRLWVTNRLATALVLARKARWRGIEPWQFALERLRLDDVDALTWAPNPNFSISAD
jgi:hypothetical protein